MPAPDRLLLLVLLAPACFRDTPPDLGVTDNSSTGASIGGTSEGTSTGSSTTTATADTTAGADTTTVPDSTGASETGCVNQAWYPDADMDGHGNPGNPQAACEPPPGWVALGDDCDDQDDQRAPSLDEVCDDKDNDCDELVDEYSAANTLCNNCKLTATKTSSYAYCQYPLSYGLARVDCQLRGGDLAVIHDAVENDVMRAQGLALQQEASQWYIGLDDLAVDNNFVWVDGSAIDYQAWGTDEPNNVGGVESCVVLLVGSGTWNDSECATPAFFICESANKQP